MIMNLLMINYSFPHLADPGYDPIHTRISSVDLTPRIYNGYSEYDANVTVIMLRAEIEVWNTDNERQGVGHYCWVSGCCNEMSVVSNVTDDLEFYHGETVTQTPCSFIWVEFDPGITETNSRHKLVFDVVNLTSLPSGEYIISAPTNNGQAYSATLNSNNGSLAYVLQEMSENWSAVPTDDSNNVKFVMPLTSYWLLGLTVVMVIFHFKRQKTLDKT